MALHEDGVDAAVAVQGRSLIEAAGWVLEPAETSARCAM
jgi:hypothetical protein